MTRFESLRSEAVLKKARAQLKRNDRVMARLIKKMGVQRFTWHWPNSYEAIMRSFIYQQISGSAGDAILKRFEALYGGRLPTPKEFLRTPEKRIRSAGISPQKYSYIKDLCERIDRRELDLSSLKNLPDEEVIAILDEVKGIGRWTAEMYLLGNLHRVNVFAMDDLGLRKAVQKEYGLRELPDKKKLAELSKKWEPYKSVASLYLWRSTDGE